MKEVNIKEILLIFLLSKLFIFSIAVISYFFIEETPWESPIPFINLFARWDSAYYMEIANSGYVTERDFAFFPLYPFLLKIFTLLPFHVSIFGFLISNLFSFFTLLLFYILTLKLFNEKVAILSSLFFSFYPSAVFLSAIYPESLSLFFIFLCLLTFLDKRYFLASIFAFLATLTKLHGLFLILFFVVEGIRKKNFKIFCLGLLPILAILLNFVYLWSVSGDFFIFFKVQKKFWGVEIFNNPLDSFCVLTYFQKLNVILFSALSLLAFFDFFQNYEQQKNLLTFYLFYLLIFAFYLTKKLWSFGRYALVFFPLNWFLSKLWIKNKIVGIVSFIIFLIFCGYGTFLFCSWGHYY